MRALLILTLALPALAGAAEPVTLLDSGYAEMYNLLFNQAHASFQEWSRVHPEDPMGPVSDAAASLFAEFERLRILQSEFFEHDDAFHADAATADPAAKRRFEEALERSRVLADRILAQSPRDANALFASVLRHGLKADYLGLIEHRYFAALGEIKAGRVMAQRLLAVDPQCYDAHLALGVENYMLSLKPAPVRWFLRIGGAQTDRETGLRQLKITADGGRYLMPYARLLLAVAALRDHDRRRATELLEYLASSFPKNPLYARELARLRAGHG
jgi:hypothetical protein